MINFKPLGTDVEIIKKYMEISPISFCDISVGTKYLWRDDFIIDYAFVNDVLIMKETCPEYENAFYFPIGKDVESALSEIEKYCLETHIPLRFCCIDNERVAYLKDRYFDVYSFNNRDWSDYIYTTEQFRGYSGKKLSGQRNHVNKFKKLYPDYIFKKIEKSDLPAIAEFLKEYEESYIYSSWTAIEEGKKVYDYISHADELEQFGGMIIADGKIAAISVGEAVGDTLIVHVEKALKGYDGVYPTMASEFVRAFASDLKYVNREEDCGDNGLRISKTQYHPIEIKEKNIVVVKSLFDRIITPVNIITDRLVINEFDEKDKEDYFRLCTDDRLNRYWGYDYREDIEENSPPEKFVEFQRLLKKRKEEYSLAVRLDGNLIGELVLYNFDYFGGVETGFRFFEEFQGKGYAFESANALKDYVSGVLKAKYVKSRCFKQNIPSYRLIKKLGLIKIEEDQEHFYFRLDF